MDGRHDRLRLGDRPPDQRQAGQRDRDRILYASALRRLAGVTQVVSAIEGHEFHNRLTHTLKVAQVGRRLAEKLLSEQPELVEAVGGLDPEVVEAASLAHDLGHPPFGHIAEQELDSLVKEAGIAEGFEGNPQSFRIVTKLAVRHEDFLGLNLTKATLNAILKYPWFRQTSAFREKKWGAFSTEKVDFAWARELYPGDDRKSAEAELMDWADDITYAVHDVEDFYRAGLIPLDRLANDSSEVSRFLQEVFERWRSEAASSQFAENDLRNVFNEMIAFQPLTTSYTGTRKQRAILRSFTAGLIARYIGGIQLQNPSSVSERRVRIEPQHEMEITMWKELTWHYVIEHPSLATQQYGQRRIIKELFRIFREAASSRDRSILPASAREFLEQEEQQANNQQALEQARSRVVADIVAGMTEQQALEMYQRLLGISPGSILTPIVR